MLVESVFWLCVEASRSLGCGCSLMAPPYQVPKKPEDETALSVWVGGQTLKCAEVEQGNLEPRLGLEADQDGVRLPGCLGFQKVSEVGAQAGGKCGVGERQALKPGPQAALTPTETLYPVSKATLHQNLGLRCLGKQVQNLGLRSLGKQVPSMRMKELRVTEMR